MGGGFRQPSKRSSRRLARPGKRHYTFARRGRDQFAMVLVRYGKSQLQSLDLASVFVDDQAKRQYPDRVGRGETDVFAPFVYRLGRHPFTVERAVRFR